METVKLIVLYWRRTPSVLRKNTPALSIEAPSNESSFRSQQRHPSKSRDSFWSYNVRDGSSGNAHFGERYQT